jgi:AraC family transcriptional regulator, regulatory protein of adaptative response / DNA-3-methyladenine glycosylase II
LGQQNVGVGMRTVLATEAPFDGAAVFRYLAGHAAPGIEDGDAASYRRRVRLPGGSSGTVTTDIDLRLQGPTSVLCTTTLEDRSELGRLLDRIRRLLDLDTDSGEVDAHLGGDPALASAVAASPGIRLPGSLDPEESLFRTLIGQQISIAAARTVTGNLVRQLCGDSGLFPTAAQIAAHGQDVLRGPAARIATILRVAEALASGALTVNDKMSPGELIDSLVRVRGIGPWTAGYVALRVLSAPDVLLNTDLVLLQGAARLGLPATPRGIADYARRWAPWRSYAGMHLWRAARMPPA